MGRSRSIWVVVAISAILVIVGVGAVIAITGDDEGAETSTASDADTNSTDDDSAKEDPAAKEEPARDNSADEDPAKEETAEDNSPASGDGADETVEARFVLEGELPLSTEEVNEMMAFIEEQTGREFLYPPTIVAQSEADYEAGLSDQSEEDIEEFEEDVDRVARYYQATGLSDIGAAELGETVMDALSDSDAVLGYYLTEEDKLFVPTDSGATDEFRSTLVHELVHAHDGQHVDLFEYTDELDDDDGEGQFVRGAIIEGRARSVEDRWVEANPPSDEAAEQELTEEQLELLTSLPQIFWNELLLPYELGVQLIDLNGGAAETWDFYETPPASSEAVLIPYRPADEQVMVAGTAADGDEVFRGTFGAVDLLLLLISETLEPDTDTVIEAVGAADGWGGGEAVIWGDSSESCVRIVLAGDNTAELAEIRTALGEWAGAADGRTVDGSSDDRVQVTACAPYRG